MAGLGRLLGTGKQADVYEHGKLALKLYKAVSGKVPAFREAEILARLEPLGLPAPIVRGVIEHDGRWGVLMTRAEGAPIEVGSLADPARAGDIVDAMATLHADIHRRAGAGFPTLRDRLARNIVRAPLLDDALRTEMLARLGATETGDRLCHGDFHPLNVMGLLDKPMIVDWLDAHQGSPAADICRSYVLLLRRLPEFAELTLAAGCRTSGIARAEVLAWLPLVAAARLAEDVPDEAEMLLALAAA